jgi:hypothetical protein
LVRDAKGAFNQIVCWSRLPDWKNQTLTPNPDDLLDALSSTPRMSDRWCSRFHPLMRVRSPAP